MVQERTREPIDRANRCFELGFHGVVLFKDEDDVRRPACRAFTHERGKSSTHARDLTLARGRVVARFGGSVVEIAVELIDFNVQMLSGVGRVHVARQKFNLDNIVKRRLEKRRPRIGTGLSDRVDRDRVVLVRRHVYNRMIKNLHQSTADTIFNFVRRVSRDQISRATESARGQAFRQHRALLVARRAFEVILECEDRLVALHLNLQRGVAALDRPENEEGEERDDKYGHVFFAEKFHLARVVYLYVTLYFCVKEEPQKHK